MMKKIDSVQNSEIKQVAALSDARERLSEGLFVAEGLRVCTTLQQAGMMAKKIYATARMLSKAIKLANLQTVVEVSDAVMKKISSSATPSGLLGVYMIPESPSLSLLSDGIVLANITDPGNMGTLIRSCAAFGKKSVVVIQGVDPYNPKVIQASAGVIANVHLFRTSWQELITCKNDIMLQALITQGGFAKIPRHNKPTLLVVGNEAHGLPPIWQKDCHELITLPMPGDTESLNAAVAGSIAMYISWIKE